MKNDRTCSYSQFFETWRQLTAADPKEKAVCNFHVLDVDESDHIDCCSVRMRHRFAVAGWNVSFRRAVLASRSGCAYRHPPQWDAAAHLLPDRFGEYTLCRSHSEKHPCSSTIGSATQLLRKSSPAGASLQELAMSHNSVIGIAKFSNPCR